MAEKGHFFGLTSTLAAVHRLPIIPGLPDTTTDAERLRDVGDLGFWGNL